MAVTDNEAIQIIAVLIVLLIIALIVIIHQRGVIIEFKEYDEGEKSRWSKYYTDTINIYEDRTIRAHQFADRAFSLFNSIHGAFRMYSGWIHEHYPKINDEYDEYIKEKFAEGEVKEEGSL